LSYPKWKNRKIGMRKKSFLFISFFLLFVFILWGSSSKEIIRRTIIIGIGSATISLFLGSIAGIVIAKGFLFFKAKLKYLFLLPLLIPAYVQAINWMDVFQNHKILGTSWIFGISYFPLVSILFLLLPNKIIYLSSSFLFVFMLSFSDPVTPEVMKIDTYPAYCINQFVSLNNVDKALNASFIPLLLAILIGVIFAIQLNGIEISSKQEREKSGNKIQKISGSCFILLLLSISFFLPLFKMLKEVTLKSFIFEIKANYLSTLLSIYIALGGSIFSLFLSLILVYPMIKNKSAFKIIDPLTLFIFALPIPIIGVSMSLLFKVPPPKMITTLYGFFLLFLCYGIRFSPYGTRILYWGWKKLHREKNSLHLSFKKMVKVNSNLILFSFFALFILCFQELCLVFIFLSREQATLPMKMELLFDYGIKEGALTITFLQLIITLIVVFIFLFLIRKRR
jgi:ABC-type Fe3+ transport system permease subunit